MQARSLVHQVDGKCEALAGESQQTRCPAVLAVKKRVNQETCFYKDGANIPSVFCLNSVNSSKKTIILISLQAMSKKNLSQRISKFHFKQPRFG